jgi:hypothetical protein
MNKKQIFVLIFSLFVLSSIFASKSDFQFHWSIGTAAISYGDESKGLVNTLVNDVDKIVKCITEEPKKYIKVSVF